MFIGLYHLSALQNKGIRIWDSFCNEVFQANLYLLFTTGNVLLQVYHLFSTHIYFFSGDGPSLIHWDGLVGYCSKNGCCLYCGVREYHKDSCSHYYPMLLAPVNAYHDSNHPNISSFHIPSTGSQEYSANLFYIMSAPNSTQYDVC